MSREVLIYAPKRTFNVDLAVSSGGIGENLVVKLGSSSDVPNDVVVAGAELAIGVTASDCFPPVNGDTSGRRQIEVILFGPTKIMKASAAISRGAVVGPTTGGKIVAQTIDTSAPATVVPSIGIALEEATADGDQIEVMLLGGYVPV